MNLLLAIQNFLKRLYETFESLLRIIILSRFSIKLPKAKNITECVILANGPSLKSDIEKNPELIRNKDLVCVNHFPTTELFESLRPAYYVTSVPELWQPDVDEKYRLQREALIASFLKKTQWPLTILLPVESRINKDWGERLKENRNISIVYFNNTPIEGFNSFSYWCFNHKLGMPRPHNVLLPSIMMGLGMGYRTIYLFGVDHSWLPEISVNEENEVLLNQKHFYDEGTSKKAPMDYKGRGKRNLGQVLHKLMQAFTGYYTVNNYASSLGAIIINCTPGSFIDAFKRLNTEDNLN